MEIRRARPNEWRELRALRLQALAEDPDAFVRTLSEEQELPKERWEEATRGVIFLAVEEAEWMGMAAVHSADGGARAEIWGMWVRPERRHQGIGSSLLEAAVEWARTEGFPAVRLGVTWTNVAAYALYRKAGFVPTGRATPLRPGSALYVRQMERSLE